MAETLGRTSPARRASKSATAFHTISEVADELDVPQHVLRFWETKFTQVKPLKRGGRRRYYRPEDIALLRRIKDLLYQDGYTIKGVQRLLREGGVKNLARRAVKPAAGARVQPTPAPAEDETLGTGKRSELEALLAELGELRDLLRARSG